MIAFQSAIPMQQYGAQIFVADLIVIAYFKELGPLMTAFVVNGRSGSAFAAELGTMKVNEELDALDTMGLDPVNFLVVPKVHRRPFHAPPAHRIREPLRPPRGSRRNTIDGIHLHDLYKPDNGFGDICHAARGTVQDPLFRGAHCGRRLPVRNEGFERAFAVGDAATTAVVMGIILMIVVDGIFGVIYYILGNLT